MRVGALARGLYWRYSSCEGESWTLLLRVSALARGLCVGDILPARRNYSELGAPAGGLHEVEKVEKFKTIENN